MPSRAALARFVVGALLAGLAVELVVRQTFLKPGYTDPDFGAVMRPGAVARHAMEGDGESHWTDHGVRRKELPPDGTPKVLVLGDSFTEALMIDDPDVFSAQLEARLGPAGDGPVVLNVGRSGATAADYLALAGRYRALFDPRWTVIQIRDDDVTDAAWRPGGQAVLERGPDGAIVGRFEPKQPSAAGRLLQALSAFVAMPSYAIVRTRQFLEAWRAEPPLFRGASAGPKPVAMPPPRDAYPVEETLDRLAAAFDGHVTFLWLPDYEPERSGGTGSETEMRVMAACRERGLSCVNLRDAFPAFRARHEAPYGFPNTAWNVGHLNAAGHRAAGELLAEELSKRGVR